MPPGGGAAGRASRPRRAHDALTVDGRLGGRCCCWRSLALAASGADAAVIKPRAVLIVPFDATALDRDEQWVGQGIAEVGRPRPRAASRLRADRATRGCAAVEPPRGVGRGDRGAGRAHAAGGRRRVRARHAQRAPTSSSSRALLEIKGARGDAGGARAGDGARRASCCPPGAAAVGLRAHAQGAAHRRRGRRMDKAAQPTRSLKAFELFARAAMAVTQRPGQEGNEQAVDLLARAIEVDPNFVVAQYTPGHRAPGARQPLEGRRAVPRLHPARPHLSRALQGARRPLPRRAAPAVRPGGGGVQQGDRAAAVLRRRPRRPRRRQGGQGRRRRRDRRVHEGARPTTRSTRACT